MTRTGSRFTWRLATLMVLFTVAGLGLTARLVLIQVVHHARYAQEAQAEHEDKQEIRSSRGALLDRNGFPLATSVDAFDVYVDRRAWRADAPNRPKTAADSLAPLLNQPSDQLLATLLDSTKGPIGLLADGVDFETGRDIQSLGLFGVQVIQATKRFYPEGDIGSALIGFLGRDHAGLAGVEADADDILRGEPGAIYFERDSTGQPIAFGDSRVDPGRPGADIRLTIDRYIQRLVETDLDQEVKDHQASGGSIIVMDPSTGAILALASRPSFKLSQLPLSGSDTALYRNRAVTDLYEPGSVMKVMTMSSAIDLGKVTPNTTYFDSGTVVQGGYTFQNWDFSANGTQSMANVLQKSLNTGAIWVSNLIGPDNLYTYFKRFGFGESTHSGMGGESNGLIRTNQEANWYSADLASNSFGQGIAATPLQVITAFSAVVNGGNLMRPYVIQETQGPSGRRTYDPVVVRRVISAQASRTMVQMLNYVVDGNPVHAAHVKGYHVGGKTGTTLVSIPTGYALDSTIASFVGFAPLDRPAFIMLVKIDQPKDDPLGGIVAAPVFGKLAPKILAYLNIPPDSVPASPPLVRSAP